MWSKLQPEAVPINRVSGLCWVCPLVCRSNSIQQPCTWARASSMHRAIELSLALLLLACKPAGAALQPVRSASATGDLPPWPATFRLNASTFVYTCSYEQLTDVSPSSIIARFGLVAFDWSEGKELWDKESPMTCEETLVAQAAALKRSNPAARVLAYRNIVKALPWQATPRAALGRADAASWVLGFAPNVTTHSPRCDTNFVPPRCSSLYHDQVQTPQYPTNSKYDGTCSEPCDCGPVREWVGGGGGEERDRAPPRLSVR